MTGVKPNLTENQTALMYELLKKKALGSITEKQLITLEGLKAKNDAPPTLSKTTISYLHQIHMEEVFNKKTEIRSKYLDKGIQVEDQSISLYSKVQNVFFQKNEKRFENEFISGTPDMVLDGMIRDIKSSWSFQTFPMHLDKIPTNDYVYQLQGYMALTGCTKAELIYCLVDTPPLMIEDEKRRTGWELGFMELPDELANEIEHNMTFSNIPESLRVKVFEMEYDQEIIDSVYAQVEVCREYLNQLSNQLAEVA